ncbi:hypothetical protein V6N11_041936 [Hibiscus sabdariffa]|uniref:Uncharacterized protein n=1 Tax=Hibiscus sabdariffa TaxID=183260 RepID=A0ABR2N7F2_9ROSI
MLWKHRCCRLMDANYVFQGDFRLCCQRIAIEYVDAFSKPSMATGSALRIQSDPLAACTLVEAISSLLNRSWSVQVKHIPQERSLVADRADAICRGGPIGMLKLMIDPVDLVVLVNKEANDDW